MEVYMEVYMEYTWSCMTSVQFMWRGVGQNDNPLASISVFVYVCNAPAVACFCRVVDSCVNGGDVILSKVTCDSGSQ